VTLTFGGGVAAGANLGVPSSAVAKVTLESSASAPGDFVGTTIS
jgi:hypothetical protein